LKKVKRAGRAVALAPSRGSPVMWAAQKCQVCAGAYRGPPGLCENCQNVRAEAIRNAEIRRRSFTSTRERPPRILPL